MGSETGEPPSGGEAENAGEAPSKDSIAPASEAPAIASPAIEKPEIPPESSSSSAPEPAVPPERKASTEDPVAIIESLRARLLAERSSSKAAKQQAQQLARKVRELERGLQAEIEERKRCEELIQELILKLEEAGVKVDSGVENSEDPEQSSSRQLRPKWISVSRSRRQSSSDGSSVEGDGLNSNPGDQQSPSSSPVSDTSLVPRRVGRSCRTLRRKESWETSEVDEQVKGNWSKVGEDMVEISKLRDSDSGWVSRAVEVLENKDTEGSWSGDQELNDSKSDHRTPVQPESSTDTEANNNNTDINVEENSPDEASNAAQSEASGDAQDAQDAQASGSSQVKNDTRGVNAESYVVGGEPSDPTSSAAAAKPSSPKPGSSVTLQPDSGTQVQGTRSSDSVQDILRALRLAKQHLRGSAMTGVSPGYRNSPSMWQPGKPGTTPGYTGLVVTRPLAQFVPATPPAGTNEVFLQVHNRGSHHSYVDNNNYYASPNRF